MENQENEIRMAIPGMKNEPTQVHVDRTELRNAIALVNRQIDNECNFLNYFISDDDILIKEAYDNVLSQKQIKQVSKTEGDFNEDLWVEHEDDIKIEYDLLRNFVNDELSLRMAVKEYLNEYAKD